LGTKLISNGPAVRAACKFKCLLHLRANTLIPSEFFPP